MLSDVGKMESFTRIIELNEPSAIENRCIPIETGSDELYPKRASDRTDFVAALHDDDCFAF